MITLTSEKGLVRVDSWDDIESRPGFVGDLDPTKHRLHAIIGRYVFKQHIRCGLSNCHTLHAKGYIAVTTDGHETNIGKDCGKTYFGVDFETLSRRFDRDITEAENRDRLWSFTFQLDDLKRRLAELRRDEKGADWVHRNIRPLITPNCGLPSEVTSRVLTMVRSRSSALTVSRKATEEELELLEAREGRRVTRSHFVEEQISDIDGFDALYTENDLRQLIAVELEEKIRAFESLDIDTLRFNELRSWSKWIDSVEPTMDRVDRAVANGRRLLTASNLTPLGRLISKQEEIAAFQRYLEGLEGRG
jgi:hypothetical protein